MRPIIWLIGEQGERNGGDGKRMEGEARVGAAREELRDGRAREDRSEDGSETAARHARSVRS